MALEATLAYAHWSYLSVQEIITDSDQQITNSINQMQPNSSFDQIHIFN